MKKHYIFLLTFSIVVSGCNFNVEILTPGPAGPTPFATQMVPTPFATIAVTAPLIPGDFGWGSIHGKITDAVSGALIVGATVTCEHHSYSSPSPCSGTATTDEDGIYFFENIYFHDTDSIKLTIQATGYQTHEITLAVSSFAMPKMEANFSLNRAP